MKRLAFIPILMLSACAATPFDIKRDELAGARQAIQAAKAAGAERCAPKLLAEAEAALYHAAHELDETGQHPDETASLIAAAASKGMQARQIAIRHCQPKARKKPEIISLSGVRFATNSAELTVDSLAVLDKAVETLKKRADIRVEVAAHTDSRGNDAYNLALSKRRAASVYRYLVEHGIDAKRLNAHGYGESRPVADNGTADGRARNRRVELRILE